MQYSSIIITAFLVACCELVLGQGPNTVAATYPNLATMSVNGTWFIIPVDRSTVQSLVKYPLLTIGPDTTFPRGFPAGQHPLLVQSSSFDNDIRMDVLFIPLQIASLLGASISVPYVDRLGDGKTPFNYPIQDFQGSTTEFPDALVPALVSTLVEGVNNSIATFVPSNAAYAQPSPGYFTSEVKITLIQNVISGPGVVGEAIDASYVPTPSPTYPASTYQALSAQPLILNGLNTQCKRETYQFNQTFTDEFFVLGNVTVYSPYLPQTQVFVGVDGYSASAAGIMSNNQDCASAAAAAAAGAAPS